MNPPNPTLATKTEATSGVLAALRDLAATDPLPASAPV